MEREHFVLVHGAWHGPWCWVATATALGQAGHDVTVVCLPGHDQPGNADRIWTTIGQYVTAVDAAVQSSGRSPILVGHSMGGYVLQRYLKRQRPIRGVAFLASVPRHGVLTTTIRLLRSRPRTTLTALCSFSLWPVVATAAQRRDLFFGGNPPSTSLQLVDDQLQNESYVAFAQMLVPVPRPWRTNVPALVVAAEEDALFTDRQHRSLARKTKAMHRTLAGGHDVMLDDHATALAILLCEWADGIASD